MKLYTLFLSTTLLLTASGLYAQDAKPATPPAVTAEGATLDFGDFSSTTLTTKAWEAHGGGASDAALAYANKCIEMYSAQAKEMQAKLTAPAPKESAHDFWALNDVGTCYFIIGLVKEGSDKAGALEAYKTLVNEYSYAQCWDTKGWFWAPADAAKGKLKTLEFEAMSESE